MPEACIEVVQPATKAASHGNQRPTAHLYKSERQIDWNRSNSIDVISYIPLVNQRNATIDRNNSQLSNDSSNTKLYNLRNNNNRNENERNGLCCCSGDSSDEFSANSCWQLKRKQIIWESSHASAKNRTPPTSTLRQTPERLAAPTPTCDVNAEANAAAPTITTAPTRSSRRHGEESRRRQMTTGGGGAGGGNANIARQVTMLSTSLPSTPNLGQFRRRFGSGQHQSYQQALGSHQQWVQYKKLPEPQRAEQRDPEPHSFVEIKRQLQMSASKLQTYANACSTGNGHLAYEGVVPASLPAKSNRTDDSLNGLKANGRMCARAVTTDTTTTTLISSATPADASAAAGIHSTSTQTQTDLALLTRCVDNSAATLRATSLSSSDAAAPPPPLPPPLPPQLDNCEVEKSSLSVLCESCCESLGSLLSPPMPLPPPTNGGGPTKTKINTEDSQRRPADPTESVSDLSLQHFVTDEDRTKQKRPSGGTLSGGEHNYIEYRRNNNNNNSSSSNSNKKKKTNEDASSRSYVVDSVFAAKKPPTICCYTIDKATTPIASSAASVETPTTHRHPCAGVVEFREADAADGATRPSAIPVCAAAETRHLDDSLERLLSSSLPHDYGSSVACRPIVQRPRLSSRIPRGPPVPPKPKSSDAQPAELYDPQTFQRKLQKFEFLEEEAPPAPPRSERPVSPPHKCELLNCFKGSSAKSDRADSSSSCAIETASDRAASESSSCYGLADEKCALRAESAVKSAAFAESNNNNYNCKIAQRRRQSPVALAVEPYLTSTLPKRALRYDSHGRLLSNSPVIVNGRGKALSETPNLGRKVYSPRETSASDELREETETEIEQEIAKDNLVQAFALSKPLASLPPLPLTSAKRIFNYAGPETPLSREQHHQPPQHHHHHLNHNAIPPTFDLKSNFVGSDSSLPCKCSCKHPHSPQSPTSSGITPTSPLLPTSPTAAHHPPHSSSALLSQPYSICNGNGSTETIESRCSNCSDQTTIFHLDNECSSSCTSPSSAGGSTPFKGQLLVKRIPVIQSFGYIPTHSGSLGSANVSEGSEKEFIMEKRRNTLERFQRLSFLARRTSPSANNASSSSAAAAQGQPTNDSSSRTRKSTEKSEKLKELTELLRHGGGGGGGSAQGTANRSSPTPPPIPPPRKPRHGSHSTSSSFEKPDVQTAKTSVAGHKAASVDGAPLSFMSTNADDILLMDQDEPTAAAAATTAEDRRQLADEQNASGDLGQKATGTKSPGPAPESPSPATTTNTTNSNTNTNEKHSLTSSAKRLYDTLKPNASLSSFESMMALGREKSKSPPPIREAASAELATQLSRPEARTVIGSYAQKGIPFRSASFSQIDYSSGKYKKSALSALADRLRRDKSSAEPASSVVATANLTLPRKKEPPGEPPAEASDLPAPREPDWIHVPLKKAELTINLSYAGSMESKPPLEDVLESPDVIPEEDVFCTDTERTTSLADVSSATEHFASNSMAAHAKMESLTDTIQSENDYIIGDLPVMVTQPLDLSSKVSTPDGPTPNLATLMEEQIPMESPPDTFLQTATTCMIPVPVYECAAQEWGMENPPAEWVEVTPEELGLIPSAIEPLHQLGESDKVLVDTLQKVGEALVETAVGELLQTELAAASPVDTPASPVETTLPTISVSRSSEEVEDKSILRRKDEASLSHARQPSGGGEVKKRYSHDDMDLGKEMRASLEGIATRHSADERKRIDKSKRRKGMYFDNFTCGSDSPDGSPASRGLALDISIANLHAIKPDAAGEEFDYYNSPATDDNRTPGSFYSFDLNTPESECTKPPVWSSALSKGQRLTNFSCHSSEEKDDSQAVACVGGGHPPPRYNRSFPYLHADSISDNESDRTPPPSRDRTSPSPAPSDSDFKRFSKRPLRGPYGQMLEAEMKKPNRLHFEEILEELRESDFNTSQPRRQRTVQDDASIGVSSGAANGGVGTAAGAGGRSNMPQYSSSMRVRKTYLPVPAHTRAASTPSQMENVSQSGAHLTVATSPNVTTTSQTPPANDAQHDDDDNYGDNDNNDKQRHQNSIDSRDCNLSAKRKVEADESGGSSTKDPNTTTRHQHQHQQQQQQHHGQPQQQQHPHHLKHTHNQSHNQREKRAASEAPAPKTHHSKRSQSMSGDKASHLQQATLQHNRSMDSAANNAKSTKQGAAKQLHQQQAIEPTQELLASLLQGSSEKLLSEQRQQMFADTRTHVVHEIFRNEQSYVDSLQTVVVKYFRVLKSPEAAGMIDSRTVDEIFFMVPDILKIHEKFLADLKSRLDSWNTTQKVGDTFMETFSKLEVLEVYTSFVNNCNRAKNAIRRTKHQRPSFAKFLESTASQHKGKLPLDNLLIKPVQKFPNYEMLFQRLIKHTEQDHPDQKFLQDSLKLVHDILVHINCKERENLENGQREAVLRELEGVIEGITDLTTPDRQFLLFDLVSMPSGQGPRKERGFFLFNDLLVLTSIKKRSGTIRKPNPTTCPGTVASTLDTNKYKFLTKISLECLEIVKTKDENVKRIMNEIENLAEDCNKLQQITEITSTLKYPHQSLEDVIRELHRDVQRQLSERQTNDTQLNMLELLVYSPNGSQKLTIVFSKSEKRTQWEETFSEAKQKLAATMERHPIPEFLTSIPIRKTRAGLQFTCAAATLSEKRDVWVCNSDGYVGQVCIMSLHPEPNVTSCNGVCNARILCVASVPAYSPNTNSTTSSSEQSSGEQVPSQSSQSQSSTPQHGGSYTQKLRDYRKSISPNCHQANERGSLSATATPEPKKKLTPLSGSSSISAGNTASNSNSDIQLDLNLSSSDEEAEAATQSSLVDRVPSPAPLLAAPVHTSASASATLSTAFGSPYHGHTDSNVEEGDGNQSTMWIGTEDGCIHVYNSTDNIRIKKNRIKIEHHSAVFSILYLDNRVFVSLANGDICVYLRDGVSGWNTSSSHCLSIGTVSSPVTKMLNVHGQLWCSIQGIIKVLDIETLLVVNQIQISSDSKPITNMTVSNNFVWISIHTSAHIKCFHSTTHQLITEVNLAPAVNKMLSNCDEIIRQHKAACLRVTSLLSCKDLIWIGTSAGVLLTIPAQGYDKGQTNVVPTGIPHGHTGHVRFLTFVEASGLAMLSDGTSAATVTKEADCSGSDFKSGSSKAAKNKNEPSNILIISGGDGYEDFRNSGANSLSEIAGREDSTNHLLIWQI